MFKSVNSFTVDNPFYQAEKRERENACLPATPDPSPSSFFPLKSRKRERWAHFNTGTIYSASIIFISYVLTFSGCNNYAKHYFALCNLSLSLSPSLRMRFLIRGQQRVSVWDIVDGSCFDLMRGTKLQIVLLTETNYFLSANKGSFIPRYHVPGGAQGAGIPSKINAREDAREGGLSKDDNSYRRGVAGV